MRATEALSQVEPSHSRLRAPNALESVVGVRLQFLAAELNSDGLCEKGSGFGTSRNRSARLREANELIQFPLRENLKPTPTTLSRRWREGENGNGSNLSRASVARMANRNTQAILTMTRCCSRAGSGPRIQYLQGKVAAMAASERYHFQRRRGRPWIEHLEEPGR